MCNFKKSSVQSLEAAIGKEILQVLPKDLKPWYRTRHLIHLNLVLLVPLFSSATLGYDGTIINGFQTLNTWREYFHYPRASILGTINAVSSIGKLLGLYPATWLSDRYGRKRPMFFGFIMLIMGTALQSASQEIGMLIVARFLLGFGTAFLSQPSPVLVTELAYPIHRGKITALYNTFYYVGAILAAWTTYGTFRLNSSWSWRIPSSLQGAFPLLQFLGFYFLPESPRWLIAQNRPSEARATLTKYHAGGDEASPLVEFEMREMEDTIRTEQTIKSQSSYVDLIRTPANRKRLVIVCTLGIFTQWSGNAVISYYLTLVLNAIGITTTSSQALINGLLQLFNWGAAVFAGAMMVDRLGRRKLFLISTSGMLASFIVWSVLSSVFTRTHYQSVGNVVVAFIFIYYFFYGIAFTPLMPAYVVEIYPYTLRGRSVTAVYTVNYLGLIIGNFCNPIAMKKIGWHYYIVFCILLSISLTLIYFFFPETKGYTLEEIAEIFNSPKESSIKESSCDDEGSGAKNEKLVELFDKTKA